jgi:hypothetical protein
MEIHFIAPPFVRSKIETDPFASNTLNVNPYFSFICEVSLGFSDFVGVCDNSYVCGR